MNYSWWKYEGGYGGGEEGDIKYIFFMLLTFPIYSFQRHFSFLLFISSCVCHDIYAYFLLLLLLYIFTIQTHIHDMTQLNSQLWGILLCHVISSSTKFCVKMLLGETQTLFPSYFTCIRFYEEILLLSSFLIFFLLYPILTYVCCCITTP